MHRIEVDIKFEYSHRLMFHEGKCLNVHGHSGIATIEIGADDLTPDGFVIDFGEIKAHIKKWVDTHWDHAYIAKYDDPILVFIQAEGLNAFPMPYEPTAENMAMYLFNVAKTFCDELSTEDQRIYCMKVWIHETKTGRACYGWKCLD